MSFMVTVSSMITRVRRLANMERSRFVTDSEIIDMLDRAHRELYDRLTSLDSGFFRSGTPFPITTVPGTALYALPSDFYKLSGIDVIQSPDIRRTMRPYSFSDRNKVQSPLSPMLDTRARYTVERQSVRFSPTPTKSNSVEVWYIPVPAVLDSSSSIEAINGYDDSIVYSAAGDCIAKEEGDPRYLISKKTEAEQRVINNAPPRDVGMSWKVIDSNSEDNWPSYRYGAEDW